MKQHYNPPVTEIFTQITSELLCQSTDVFKSTPIDDIESNW